MAYPVMPLGFLGSQGTSDEDSYKIERSLRLNSADSAYLNRTPASAGNRKTWTWSGWVKFCKDSASRNDTLMCTDPSGTGAGNSFTLLYKAEFSASYPDCIGIYDYAGATANCNVVAKPLIRDYSSWYHVVFSCDTTQSTDTNRVKIYFNGVQQDVVRGSGASAIYPSQNFEFYLNNTYEHTIGAYQSNAFASYRSNFYLAEINFIDGQALTPSSFGETDAITGRWKAKAFSGTYGTNGFYLNFSDNSSLTTTSNVGIGKDFSGNGNYWATNGLSVTAGADNDSLLDSPTNNGTSGNYATWNPLSSDSSFSLSDGNLKITVADNKRCLGSIGVSTGKWYWEITTNVSGTAPLAGVTAIQFLDSSPHSSTITSWFGSDSYKDFTASSASTTTTYTDGTYGFALNLDLGELKIYKNGTLDRTDSTIPSNGSLVLFPVCWTRTGYGSGTTIINFGQRPFAHTAPAGFKALCTTNLPTPIIQKPSKYMDVVTYTGTGSSQTISGLGFSPDLVWIKRRSGANSHALFDTTRGAGYVLGSDNTYAEGDNTAYFTSFTSDGFSLALNGGETNLSGSTYVAWAWDEAPIAGMDIVGYTGTSVARTISHNLGVAPKMMIIKDRSGLGNEWAVYHASLPSASYSLLLNTTGAQSNGSPYFNNTAPTSSVFSVSGSPSTNWGVVNYLNSTYIAYLFAEVEGFSKFGSYTGNGSSDGPFVWCGFRPRWVLYKRADASGTNWATYDTSRDSFNVSNNLLRPNISDAELTSYTAGNVDILSNGFKVRATWAGANASGGTHIFAAFAESPFKYARAR